MSREYRIESSHLPLSYFGGLSHPAVRGVYLEELPYSVSGTSEISSEHYSIIEDGNEIAGVHKVWMSWGDSFELDIYDTHDEIGLIAVILAIDAVMDTNRSLYASS